MSMYSFSNEDLNKINETQRSLPFPVSSCVNDVTLRECKMEELGTTGINAMMFYWERNVDGVNQVLRQSIIEINKENILDRASNNGQNGPEELEKQEIRFKSKITHICSGFGITKESIVENTSSVTSFKQLGSAICSLINNANTDQKFFMKTVVNKKGYVETAAFPNFIQKMSDGICNMKYSKYELEMIEKNRQPLSTVTTDSSSEGEVPVASTDWTDTV